MGKSQKIVRNKKSSGGNVKRLYKQFNKAINFLHPTENSE